MNKTLRKAARVLGPIIFVVIKAYGMKYAKKWAKKKMSKL